MGSSGVKSIISSLLLIYELILIVRLLSSWFPPPVSGPLRTAYNLIYDVTEPVLRPVRGLVPPIRMGMMAMDLSPILVFVVIAVIQRALG
jgi:YggT family protein